MILILSFIAGNLIFVRSFKKIVEHKLDAPRLMALASSERERSRVTAVGLTQVEALLDTWDEQRRAQNGTERRPRVMTATEVRERIDSELSESRAESDRAAKAALEQLPRLERMRALARVADAVFVVIGAVLMVVSPILGISMAL